MAKDIIEQIKIGRYIANNNSYIKDLTTIDENKFSDASEICDVFDEIKECKVCALGATILSATHLGNRLKVGNLNINYPIGVGKLRQQTVIELLESIFSDETLFLIESCFEGFTHDDDRYAVNVKDINSRSFSYDVVLNCNRFKNKYDNIDDRLIAICENIINNDGEFII